MPAFLGATWFTALVVISNEHYGIDRHVWYAKDDRRTWEVPTMLTLSQGRATRIVLCGCADSMAE